MLGHVRTKSADFVIYRIWASFEGFWSDLLHYRQHNWCLLISRSHIQLPRGQARTQDFAQEGATCSRGARVSGGAQATQGPSRAEL